MLHLGVAFLALLYTTPPVLIRLTTILKMPGTTSRKAFEEFIKAAQGDICVIPSDIFADIMKENQQRGEKICNVLQRIAVAIETGEDMKKNHFDAMEMKMDQMIIAQNDTSSYETCMADIGERITKLTEAISRSSTAVVETMESQEKSEDSTNKNIIKLKDLRGQYLRSEKTSEVIEELLAKDNPYVQRKYRVKVSEGTHEDEIPLHKAHAADNARRDVERMKIRMKRWDNEINDLKAEINDALSKPSIPPERKLMYEQQIMKNEEMNEREREEAVAKIKKSHDDEIKSGAVQFLLKYSDDREGNASNNRGDHDPSKNYSGRYRQRSFWRSRYRPK